MRPINLEIRGFMAFREPATVDFTGRRLFAITGPTGAGKSSLLDAMTWALYGQVPRVGRETAQLVNHSAKSMTVIFDFAVHGTTYRVSRDAPSTIGTRLERLDGTEWTPLEDRSRAVTARVTELTGLDYPTFIRTILLPQGAFDEFLTGDASDRRDILTRLLGLERYERAGQHARSMASRAQSAADALRAQASNTADGLPSIDEAETMLANAEQRLELSRAHSLRLAAVAESASTLHTQTILLSKAHGTLQYAQRDRQSTHSTIAQARAALDAAERSVAEGETAVAAIRYDEDEHRTLQRLAERVTQYDNLRRASADADREHSTASASAHAAVAARAAADRTQQDAAACEQRARAHAAHVRVAFERSYWNAVETRSAIGRGITEARERQAQDEQVKDQADEHLRVVDALVADHRARTLRYKTTSATHGSACADHERAERGLASASSLLASDEHVLHEALEQLEAARQADMAKTLQLALSRGDNCPVCGHTIDQIDSDADTKIGHAQHLYAEAERAVATSRSHVERARITLTEAEMTARHAAEIAATAEQARTETASRLSTLGTVDDTGADCLQDAVSAAQAAGKRLEHSSAALAALVPQSEHLHIALAKADSHRDPDSAIAAGTVEAYEAAASTLDGARTALVSADAEVTRTEQERRAADESAHTSEMRCSHTNERLQRASDATTTAQSQLEALGMVPNDSAGTLARLHALDGLAERHGAASRVLQHARETRIATNASWRSAQSSLDRVQVTYERSASEHDAAALAERAARIRVESTWNEAQLPAPANVDDLETIVRQHDTDLVSIEHEHAASTSLVTRINETTAMTADMNSRADTHEEDARAAETVAQDLRRDRFMSFVQREALHLLAMNATPILNDLSHGQFDFDVDDDSFVIIDHYSADERRSVRTLSGGETFLASLSLALALSERLPEIARHGGVMALDALFLDEGFGTLDRDAIDTALTALETLAGQDRMVGVISHVAEIAERITDHIEVEKAAPGESARLISNRGEDTNKALASASAVE